MHEGWSAEDYLILFSEVEGAVAADRYGISTALPGYRLHGLVGWDDFIVCNATGGTYRVPTVPLDRQFMRPFALPSDLTGLKADARLAGRIKWYVQPVVFGGDPNVGDNLTWVTHDQHAQLVVWWNRQYQALKRS